MIIHRASLSRRKLTHPTINDKINWGHPIAKDLKICLLCNTSNSRNARINLADPSNNGVLVEGFGPVNTFKTLEGFSINNTDPLSTARIELTRKLIGSGANSISIMTRAIPVASASAYTRIVSLEYTNSTNATCGLYQDTTNWRFYVQGAGDLPIAVSTGGVADTICGVYNKITQRLYKNGFQVASSAQTTALDSSGVVWDILSGRGLASINFLGAIFYAMVWLRPLSAAEVLQLAYDPFCFLYSPKVYGFSTPVSPLTINSNDTLALTDANSNSGYSRAAVGKFDAFAFLDSIAIVGGDPDYHITFGDNILLQDQLQSLIPALQRSFSDSINNLAETISVLLGIPIKAFDSQFFNWGDAMSVALLTPLSNTFSDTINNLLDSASVVRGNVPILVTIADTINFIADAQRFYDILRVVAGDNFVLSDAIQLRFRSLLKVGEALTAFLESVGIKIDNRPAFSDSFTLTDAATLSMRTQQSITKGDALSLTDAVVAAATGTYNGSGFIQRIRRYLNDIN